MASCFPVFRFFFMSAVLVSASIMADDILSVDTVIPEVDIQTAASTGGAPANVACGPGVAWSVTYNKICHSNYDYFENKDRVADCKVMCDQPGYDCEANGFSYVPAWRQCRMPKGGGCNPGSYPQGAFYKKCPLTPTKAPTPPTKAPTPPTKAPTPPPPPPPTRSVRNQCRHRTTIMKNTMEFKAFCANALRSVSENDGEENRRIKKARDRGVCKWWENGCDKTECFNHRQSACQSASTKYLEYLAKQSAHKTSKKKEWLELRKKMKELNYECYGDINQYTANCQHQSVLKGGKWIQSEKYCPIPGLFWPEEYHKGCMSVQKFCKGKSADAKRQCPSGKCPDHNGYIYNGFYEHYKRRDVMGNAIQSEEDCLNKLDENRWTEV